MPTWVLVQACVTCPSPSTCEAAGHCKNNRTRECVWRRAPGTPVPAEPAPRMFPVLVSYQEQREMPSCPSKVPWSFVSPFEDRAKRNHGQSLQRLAERGGLGVAELVALVDDLPLHSIFGNGDAPYLPRLLELLTPAVPPETGPTPAGPAAGVRLRDDQQLRKVINDILYPDDLPYPGREVTDILDSIQAELLKRGWGPK